MKRGNNTMENNYSYLSTIEKVDERYHRSYVILHKDHQWHFGDFANMDQLDMLAKTLGFNYKLMEERPFLDQKNNIYRKYSISHKLISPCDGGFWKLEQLPDNAKPIKALSNGSIVTCYFTNDGESIRMYRPNPNATEENKNRYRTVEEYENAVKNRIYYPNSLEFDAVYKPLPIDQHIAHCKIYGTY
jgi:hypothetical protein